MKRLFFIFLLFLASVGGIGQETETKKGIWGVKASFGKVINYLPLYNQKRTDEFTFCSAGLVRRGNFSKSQKVRLQIEMLYAKHNYFKHDTIKSRPPFYVGIDGGWGVADRSVYSLDYRLTRWSLSFPVSLRYSFNTAKQLRPKMFVGIKPSWFYSTSERFTLLHLADNKKTQEKNQYHFFMPFIDMSEMSLFGGIGLDIVAKKYLVTITGQVQWAVYDARPPVNLHNSVTEFAGDMYGVVSLTVYKNQ